MSKEPLLTQEAQRFIIRGFDTGRQQRLTLFKEADRCFPLEPLRALCPQAVRKRRNEEELQRCAAHLCDRGRLLLFLLNVNPQLDQGKLLKVHRGLRGQPGDAHVRRGHAERTRSPRVDALVLVVQLWGVGETQLLLRLLKTRKFFFLFSAVKVESGRFHHACRCMPAPRACPLLL